jgi:hypothetical protein
MQFKKISLIAPSLYQERLCDLFSTESSKDQQEYYAKKGEGNLNKLKAWSYNGKMAEFAVFNTLISYNHYQNVSDPDIMIYGKDRKSHDADIRADGKSIHVKSCMVVEGREPSWLFSTEDRLVHNPSENDIVALVVINSRAQYVAYFIQAKELVGNYKKPVSEKTIAHAIYENDLIS